MKTLISEISAIVSQAFADCGYDPALGNVVKSSRPDLCEFQCNGAMAGAKLYRKKPYDIACEVLEKIGERPEFETVVAIMPGFLNIILSGEYLADYLRRISSDAKLGANTEQTPKKIVIDYGGPNVAKPLHVGHLRSAIIGESIKRIYRFYGNDVTGDVHLGDWGLQMGLIIKELESRRPELVYFDDNYTGEYPEDAPFTLSELEEIYPTASKKSKEDAEFAEAAHTATYELQQGRRGYRALWKQILALSIPDLKKNYENLDVHFDVWKGESDAQDYIAPMIEMMKSKGLAQVSEGALIMDVREESDAKEIPPCILMKSDGSVLYHTTDLATLVQREKDYAPDKVLYVVDKRQELHFTQVFRAARKSGIVRPETELAFLGFGTMNGRDGKPYKTREGGVMRLERLIKEINDAVYEKSLESEHISDEQERVETSRLIAMAALKYGDLSNQASKDYIFDIDRFASFDGNTGPYLLYNIVRIKNILAKYDGKVSFDKISESVSPAQKALMLTMASYNDVLDAAYSESAPHKLCALCYDLANAFNSFYNETKILTEPDEGRRASFIGLIALVKTMLETAIELLGFAAPERM